MKSDADLKREFDRHGADFTRLAALSKLDGGFEGSVSNSARAQEVGISDDRWQEYASLLQKVGIKRGIGHRDDFPLATFFYEECDGSAINHICKGYVYSDRPLKPIHKNLDDQVWEPNLNFMPLGRNWYLFVDAD